RGEHAELIALRVGQHHPGRIALPHVNAARTHRNQPIHLDRLIVGYKIQVQTILDRLRLGHVPEIQRGARATRITNLYRDVAVIHNLPVQRLGPPASERRKIVTVDGHFFPSECHGAMLREPRGMQNPRKWLARCMSERITMYGAEWCGDCRRSKKLLDEL